MTTLRIRVIIRPLDSGEIDHDRTIDHYDPIHRKWLNNTTHWAMHNGRSVTMHPVGPDD